METPNYRKASIYFDDETVLEVTQRGGGGSGVGGETGLAAVNLKTGESTNAALAAKDETIAEQAATIIELQEELADVPTIEALNVTANGTYSEAGKAYSPITVNVPEGAVLKTVSLKVANRCGEPVYFAAPFYSSGAHRWQNACRLVASGGEAQTVSMTIIDNGDIDNINFTMFCISASATAALGSPTSNGFSDIATTHASNFMNVNIKVDYTKSTDSLTINIT